MATVVFYFQVHQPYRLRRYSVFDESGVYFDDEANGQILRKVADKCYRPATQAMLDIVRAHEGNVRVAYSITGTVLEQFQRWAPDVVELFRELVATGCCELLCETTHHSLSFLYSREEFERQVRAHRDLMRDVFGVTPRVFRNTELMYANELAYFVSGMMEDDGTPMFDGVICEGVDRMLGHRKPTYVYRPPTVDEARGDAPFGLLLKHYQLSDDIAFRFGNRGWVEWPLRAETFAEWVHAINGDGYLCNLFMDYETFGEHQWQETGIFDFLRVMPEKLFDLSPGQNHFCTPSEALAGFDPVGEYDVPEMTSWADTERDLSAWLGNAMQSNAQQELYKLEGVLRGYLDGTREDPDGLAELWRKLTTSDHVYYMCTKYFADGDVHKYFNPYDSPYDSYINFMNVLDHLRGRLSKDRVVVRAGPGVPGGV
ncbi:MAG: glycoside hydrolase family 57 protein [Planctomycetota bacterium]|jgi:alpha-amylase